MNSYDEYYHRREAGMRVWQQAMKQAMSALVAEVNRQMMDLYFRPEPHIDPELVIEAIEYTYQARCRRQA